MRVVVRYTQRDPESAVRELWGGNFSMRRADCLAIGMTNPGFTEHYHADRDFGIRCLEAGLTGMFDRALAATHLHERTLEAFIRDVLAARAPPRPAAEVSRRDDRAAHPERIRPGTPSFPRHAGALHTPTPGLLGRVSIHSPAPRAAPGGCACGPDSARSRAGFAASNSSTARSSNPISPAQVTCRERRLTREMIYREPRLTLGCRFASRSPWEARQLSRDTIVA